jgi:hypothetical protein
MIRRPVGKGEMRQTNPRPDFDDRPRSAPIVFAEASTGHASKKAGIDDGDTVTLGIGDVRIVVVGVRSIGPNRYRGTIDGFEMYAGDLFKGYRIGEVVDFDARKVFAAQTL